MEFLFPLKPVFFYGTTTSLISGLGKHNISSLGKENEIFQHPEKRKEILRKQHQKLKERIEAKKF
jgi:hypothetical protein